MRKHFLISILLGVSMCLAGCDDNSSSNISDKIDEVSSVADEQGVDYDLTEFSSTMVYSQLYNMLMTPDEYLGKTIKMSGTFDIFDDPKTGKTYYGCIVTDTAGCCSQGLEFATSENIDNPEDLPKMGDKITVQGVLDSYEEDGLTYYRLKESEIVE